MAGFDASTDTQTITKTTDNKTKNTCFSCTVSVISLFCFAASRRTYTHTHNTQSTFLIIYYFWIMIKYRTVTTHHFFNMHKNDDFFLLSHSLDTIFSFATHTRERERERGEREKGKKAQQQQKNVSTYYYYSTQCNNMLRNRTERMSENDNVKQPNTMSTNQKRSKSEKNRWWSTKILRHVRQRRHTLSLVLWCDTARILVRMAIILYLLCVGAQKNIVYTQCVKTAYRLSVWYSDRCCSAGRSDCFSFLVVAKR